jgi:predicted dehydrogenase
VLSAVVVGAGHIGRQHVAAVGALPGARVEAVCDLSPATAAMLADRYGVPASYARLEDALAELSPDVVHVATPIGAHVAGARAALGAGAHVIVEKPAAPSHEEVVALVREAEAAGRGLVEDYNYVFDARVQRTLAMLEAGELGELLHVDVEFFLDLRGAAGAVGAASSERAPVPPGAAADILPHLCSLSNAFVGPHREVRAIWEEEAGSPVGMRALVGGERGTATLGFSARAQPDQFAVRVEATRGHVEIGLFEPIFVLRRPRSGPRPITPLINLTAAAGSLLSGGAGGLRRKLKGGAGSYEGLWRLVELCYAAWGSGTPPPLSSGDVLAVNELARDILAGAPR